MRESMEQRAIRLAVYMIENRATVRATARTFGISKSTVHKDLVEKLPQCDQKLYGRVRQLLDENKAERHIRGGMATRERYRRQKE